MSKYSISIKESTKDELYFKVLRDYITSVHNIDYRNYYVKLRVIKYLGFNKTNKSIQQ